MSLTSGPITAGPGETTWRWQGKPAGWPHDPATHDPLVRPARTSDAERRATAKQQKKRVFAAALDEGLSVAAAARRAGIDPKTGYGYRKELQGGQAEAS